MEGIPPKMGDPERLTLPREFGNATKTFALANFGASIKLMPYSFYQKFELLELKTTRITIHMANRSVTYLRGIVEVLLVKIRNFIFPIDFVVIDMKEDEDLPIILGIPLLNTAKALVDTRESKLTLRVGKKEITFEVDDKFKISKAQYEIFFMDGMNEDNELVELEK